MHPRRRHHGRRARYLPHTFALVAFESAVFLGNGRRRPLTAPAKRWGGPKAYVGDTFWLAAVRALRERLG